MPSAVEICSYTTDPLAFIDGLTIPGAHGPARFGDCMADFQADTFRALVPALLAVAAGSKPPVGKFWIERTKGGSKDSDLACVVLWLLAFTRRPLLVQVGASDQDQAGELRKAAVDLLRLNPWLGERIDVQTWKLVCSATGSACEIVAADTAGSHGARPDVLILNELSHVTREEFASNLMDNSAKVPHGLVAVATNAGFVGTWQKSWRQIATDSPDRWSVHIWNRPSPWLDPADIEEARRRNSASRFNRLWHGVWASGTGDALDAADIAAAVRLDGPLLAPVRGFGFVAGLDLGISRDHAALAAVAKHGTTGRLRLASCRSWAPQPGGQVDLEAVELEVLAAHRLFRFSAVNYDPFQAELMAQRLRRLGVPMNAVSFSGKNLNEMATVMLESFRSHVIDLFDDPLLVRDLARLTIVEKSYGHRLEATRDADGHADRATALALALLAAKNAYIIASGTWGGTITTGGMTRLRSGDNPYGENKRALPFPVPSSSLN